MLNQTRLKQLLMYDEATGMFRWQADRGRNGNGAKTGSVAGSPDGKGYVLVRIDGKLYRAHRLAFLYMTGAFPPDQVDHINGDRADNRWCNLRPATASQNGANRAQQTNRLGVKGVRRAPSGRFEAMVTFRGKQVHLGTYDTITAAHAAYAKAANDLHGDFARVA